MIVFLLAVYFSLPAAGPGADLIPVRVVTGSGTRTIGRELERLHVIRSAECFVVWARLLGAEGRLQAGVYALSPSLPPPIVVLHLKQGQGAQQGVTIPEGFDLAQIAAALTDAGLADGAAFLTLAGDPQAVLADMDLSFPVPGASLEGYLFPDTYRIAPGTATRTILRTMVARFQQVLAPMIEATPLPAGFDVHALVTLASLVEKEAKVAEERPLIAAVFLKRLELGMPLQSDPSVKYVLPHPPLHLSLEDIAVDSPYNTYKYPGLPPGPIASPGRDAIAAVLAPARTDYLYFVARGDGTHIFSRNYQEHLAARRQVELLQGARAN